MGEVIEALLPRPSLLPKVPQDGLNVMFPTVASAQAEELSHQPFKSHQRGLVGGLVEDNRLSAILAQLLKHHTRNLLIMQIND